MLQKLTAFTKTVAGLPDVPSPAMSALELKQWFDTAPEEQRVAFNALIDALGATTTGDSGAEAIGVEPIVGIGATNVQDALEQLRVLINDAVAGAIPDGTITPAKLSFDPATQPELNAHAADNTHSRYAVATGTANTYAITLSPAPSSYFEGMTVRVKINALNSGASTINANGLGARAMKNSEGNDFPAGSLKVGIVYTFTDNGTNFILQGEGGGGAPWIGDWSAYQTVYDWSGTTVSIPATSYGTFLNITGEGFLVFARGDGATALSINPDVRITVDGVSYVFDGVDAGVQNQGNIVVHPIYYKTSLKIEVFNRGASALTMRCDYTYLAKVANPSKSQTLLNASNRKMAYATNATTTNTDVVNITGSGYLLAIEFTGFYTSVNAATIGIVTVDSVVKISNRLTFFTASENSKQHAFTGPIRFETNLKVQHRVSAVGSTAITRVWYVLD